jgi:hypothetical protein
MPVNSPAAETPVRAASDMTGPVAGATAATVPSYAGGFPHGFVPPKVIIERETDTGDVEVVSEVVSDDTRESERGDPPITATRDVDSVFTSSFDTAVPAAIIAGGFVLLTVCITQQRGLGMLNPTVSTAMGFVLATIVVAWCLAAAACIAAIKTLDIAFGPITPTLLKIGAIVVFALSAWRTVHHFGQDSSFMNFAGVTLALLIAIYLCYKFFDLDLWEDLTLGVIMWGVSAFSFWGLRVLMLGH